jgi:hypothetical protein
MSYRIERLTSEEYATLCWLADRGYDGGILAAAGVEEETADGGAILGEISEPDAWEISDDINADPHAFLTCNGSDELADKLLAFVNSII